MALDRSRGSSDDHLVADLAPGLGSRRGAAPTSTPPRSAQGSKGSHPAPRRLDASILASVALAISVGGCGVQQPSVATQPPSPHVSSSAAPIASDQAGAGLGGLHIATGPASHSRLLRFT
jgi:hypothetical protein